MVENGKRKDAPSGGGDQRSKKKKTGNGGKWKTPHQQAKVLSQDANLQPGDTGIWITCARHQEAKAAREVAVLFAEYAEKIYGIKSVHDTQPARSGVDDGGGTGEDDDIETAIRKEVAALTARPSTSMANPIPGENNNDHNNNRMTPLKMNVDCLLFVKTQPPIDPVAFVRKICEDARRCEEVPGLMRCRYVNRLTPVSVMGKASENGLVEVARQALGQWFDLSGKKKASLVGGDDDDKKTIEAETKGQPDEVIKSETKEGLAEPTKKPLTFAIRPSIRNHSNLKRDVVINTIAGLINDDFHKVNLSSPDKVILVDVYQTVCGMSVVDGDWDELKRYNLTELYSQGRSAGAPTSRD